MARPDYDVAIVGGGLAGLTASILLARNNAKVILFEKNQYPFHKVCGEYVSNEALGFLKRIGFDPFAYGASRIAKLTLSSPSGKSFSSALEMGGFGLSRYVLDEALFKIAVESGVEVRQEKVTDVNFTGSLFEIKTQRMQLQSNFVLGSYGKRSKLDKNLQRDFIQRRSPFMAVKYHMKVNHPKDEISLHAFNGGYCGLVKIEADKYNLCYLYRLDRKFNDVNVIEGEILSKNPHLKKIFREADFVSSKPEVISEVSFEKKELIENHAFMLGDSAGLIAPLCGNGMAMAIHSAKLLSELLIDSKMLKRDIISAGNRTYLEKNYHSKWNKAFSSRLRMGRMLQPLFLKPIASEITLRTLGAWPSLTRQLVSQTHGKSF